MIKLFTIFIFVAIIAFFLGYKAPMKTRLVIAFLAFLVPAIVTFLILYYSGDKPTEGAVKYTDQAEDTKAGRMR